ncbi:MAG TPA: VWA domain-containing protein [Thermoanaerobaculia bacterium]|nr:VWA domain-containing protein [Thermoanaerobaculia bacterium]
MKRILLVLLLVIAAVASAEEKPLSRDERKERIAKLPEQHRHFLIDVEPIILETERDTFLRLETDAQRDTFIEDFWRRRDVAAGTTNHGFKKEYEARLEHVKENFGQVSSDRGRIYLLHGTPTAIIDANCPSILQPLQIWEYNYLPGQGTDAALVFYIPRNHRDYRLWAPMRGMGYADLKSGDLMQGGLDAQPMDPRTIINTCREGERIVRALALMQHNELAVGRLFEPPKMNEEDVNRILRSVVLADPNAPKLAAEATVAYPAGDGSKTDAQIRILVPRAQLGTTTAGSSSVYTIDVIGEVLRDEKMYERYRYRFDFPGDMQDETLPIVIDRMLRPASYKSRVKLTDPATGAQTILENDLVVPVVAAAVTAEGQMLKTIAEELVSTRATVKILPLGENVISGLQQIQTMVSGSGVKSVEFWLDGKKIATRRAPPYTLDLDFGTVPKARKIRVVALDAHGELITGDEVTVNTGTDPFRVRIASPRVAPKLSGPTRVEVEVRVPEGKVLNAVELYWNETRIATMYDPPFVQTVHIPSKDGIGYLRAVATLKEEGIDPSEDVVLVNAPDYVENVDVHLVELPTTVLRDGKPVQGLAEASFKVLDEGQPVKISKFEYVKDLPLSIGMAVDTSGSMEEKMTAAREAGASFFQNVLKKGDKAFLVAFDSQPHLVQKWSSDMSEIHSGLAKLRPEESTALYDAVVYSLYNFQGVKGQKALILVSDGRDTSSKFSFEQALEYAQRAAVPIYAIGIGIRTTDFESRSKVNKLCSETGGTPYYIESATDLKKIYEDIQNELRAQYVLGFYPPATVKAGSKWREVTVQTAEGKAKTIRGYFP